MPNGEIKQNFETAVVLRKEYTTTVPQNAIFCCACLTKSSDTQLKIYIY